MNKEKKIIEERQRSELCRKVICRLLIENAYLEKKIEKLKKTLSD